MAAGPWYRGFAAKIEGELKCLPHHARGTPAALFFISWLSFPYLPPLAVVCGCTALGTPATTGSSKGCSIAGSPSLFGGFSVP